MLTFLGGIGLFLFGVQTASEGLQKFAANRLREILLSLTKRTYLAVIFGVVMTVAFQSSAATTVLVVEFVNAGLMNLAQALGIVLGSAVGTSIAIQLLAFKMLPLALGMIFTGFILYLWVGVSHWRHLGQGLIGFGIIFVGMAYISNASLPLKNISEVYTFLSHLGNRPVLAYMVGLGLTAVIQNSTVAIMMSLAGQHLLPIGAMIPLVLGAHTGGTVMALISSTTAKKKDAKRAAIANMGYKLVGTILVFPFLTEYARLVQWTTGDLQRQVANAHLLFALFMVIVFLPFNSLIAKGLERLLPDHHDSGSHLQLKFIDLSSLEVPAVALKQSFQEIKSLGRFISEKMMLVLPEALLAPDNEPATQIARCEKEVDWYYHHISRFLLSLSKKGLTDEQMEENINAQFILKELEYIGDSLNSMATIIHKVHRQNLSLQQDEWEHLKDLYDSIMINYTAVLEALEHWDSALATKVIHEHPEIIRIQRSLQFNTLARIPGDDLSDTGIRDEEKLRYASVDIINLFSNIDEHVVNIAQVVTGIV